MNHESSLLGVVIGKWGWVAIVLEPTKHTKIKTQFEDEITFSSQTNLFTKSFSDLNVITFPFI